MANMTQLTCFSSIPTLLLYCISSSCMQDETNKTPASARHKRGCNCRRSSCLKKYCECFQVGFLAWFILFMYKLLSFDIHHECSSVKGGVGCSVSCRCEGCQNAYGRKEGKPFFGLLFRLLMLLVEEKNLTNK